MTALFPETNNWRAGMQEVSAAIDDTMGELVEVTPAKSGGVNFPSTPEPDKAVTVVATFTYKATTTIMGEGKQYGGHSINPLISTNEPIFQFGFGVLPWPLKQGYLITRLCSGETYEVKDIKSDGVSRITVPVVQLGRAKAAQ